MGVNQLSTNQTPVDTGSKAGRAGLNKSLFLVVIFSVLLTAVFIGPIVYFWQKSTSEKVINSLEQKIVFLEEQTFMKREAKVTSQPIANANDDFYIRLDDINMDLDDWNVFSGSIVTAYQVSKNIWFKYPSELYFKDYSSENSTIWLENGSVPNQAASITIEVAPGQIKSSIKLEGLENVRKTDFTVNRLDATKYEAGKGVAYDLLNPNGENEFMSFQITFWRDSITSEERLAGEKIIEQIVGSFRFI